MARRRVREKKITGKMQRKLVALFALVLVALIGLSIRLMYIRAASGDKYTKQVLSQMGYRSQTIPFRRGAIRDINGETLARSEKVYYVILDCSVLNDIKDDDQRQKVQNATIRALTEQFPELDAETLRGYLRDKPDSSYIRLLKEVPYDTAEAFQNLMEKEDSNITGVWFEETYIRKYPGEHLASNLLGFTLSGDVGNWGVEQTYNDQLNGIAGRTYGYLNGDSNVETVTKAAVDGNDVVLNLDANIQRIVEKYVTAFNEEHRNQAREGLGSKNTAVIVMNPKTGAILAECAYPYYNLNDPRDLTYLQAYTKEQVDAMSDEEKQEKLNGMWRNFCISDTYEPGSTFKPFTVAMGLESGALTGQESYYCNGYEVVDGTTVKCSHTSGHGQLSFLDTVGKSCNDALMQMSYQIGIDNFTKYQAVFGFGKKTGIDLKGEVNAAGLLFTKEKMQPIDLAVNSFGQNFNVTMTQMMAGFCALVNGGYYYQPQVAARIENAEGDVVETFRPKLLKQIISQETSQIIREQMRTVVESGTGRSAAVPGYDVGGKTGTAEKFPRGQGTYLVSFMGCAPVDDPEIAVYVVIDEPNVEDQANSKLAVTLFQQIMAEVLPYYGVTRNGEDPDSQVETDWSVVDETWENSQSFVDGEIEPPGQEGSQYYENGNTASTEDDGENEPSWQEEDGGETDWEEDQPQEEDGGETGGEEDQPQEEDGGETDWEEDQTQEENGGSEEEGQGEEG